MKKPKIRPIVIGIFLHQNRILVFEGWDHVKEKRFFRPLGGAIKFWEAGAEALQREIKEEIGQEIEDVRYLGLIENRFTCDGQAGHEIVLVYSGNFIDGAVFEKMEFAGCEDDGSEIRVRWVDISYFSENPGLLVPEELLDILKRMKD